MQSLICEGCQNAFDENTKTPRILDCGCISCENCLRIMFRFFKRLECATHNLVTNKRIEDLEIFKFQQQSQNLEQIEKQQLTLKENQNCQKILQQELRKFCTIHSKPLNYFCQQENKEICSSCVQSSSHSNHTELTVENRIKKIQNLFSQNYLNLQKQINDQKQQFKLFQEGLEDQKIIINKAIRQNIIHFQNQIKAFCQDYFRKKYIKIKEKIMKQTEIFYGSQKMQLALQQQMFAEVITIEDLVERNKQIEQLNNQFEQNQKIEKSINWTNKYEISKSIKQIEQINYGLTICRA